MSSAESQNAYNQSGFSEPMEAQDHFAQQYDLGNPEEARSLYQRIMHQHTMQQFESATASRRRSADEAAQALLPSETSRGTMTSTASSGSLTESEPYEQTTSN
ncbi:hypothetical protein LTR65_006807 [Meristemomyces frigidus]